MKARRATLLPLTYDKKSQIKQAKGRLKVRTHEILLRSQYSYKRPRMSGWRIFGGEKKTKTRIDKDAPATLQSPCSVTTSPSVASSIVGAEKEASGTPPAAQKETSSGEEAEKRGEREGGIGREGGEGEDDTYDVLATIEKTSMENRKMLLTLIRRSKALEERLDEYDKLFSRLTEFLDIQQMNDVRQHNRLLRLGMPVPFRSTQTDRVGMDRVPAHSADRWQSVAQGPMIHRHAIFHNSSGQPMCNVGMHRDI